MKRRDRLWASACAMALAALAAAGCASAPDGGWVTSGDRSRLLTPERLVMKAEVAGSGAPTILLDPDAPLQTMVGFGAAVTDATAHLIQTRMTPSQRDALLRDLFGRENGGLGFDFTRVTIGASDFSLNHYSLADAEDPSLAGFSVAPMAAEVFPTVRQALAINPELKVMATPWSAPGWMKTTAR
jgi:glucosylceramidase